MTFNQGLSLVLAGMSAVLLFGELAIWLERRRAQRFKKAWQEHLLHMAQADLRQRFSKPKDEVWNA